MSTTEASRPDGSDQSTSPFTAPFDGLVKKLLDQYHVPGIAVAVVHGDDTFSTAYGTAQFPDVPVTPETLFMAGSTTKAITCAAISLLVDDDKNYPDVKWTTPINTLLPDDFLLPDDYSTRNVTLEDAALHRSGMPRHDYAYGAAKTSTEIIRLLRHLPLTAPIRTKFQYCNTMYVALSCVIEKVTGQSYGEFVAERIFKPLGMDATTCFISDAKKSGQFARGQYWQTASEAFTEIDYVDLTAVAGAGAVISNVVDYAKWVRMMINRNGPVSVEQHKMLVAPQAFVKRGDSDGMPRFYGYGWEIEHYRGYEAISHGGGIYGFGANVLYVPAKKWGCVMLANSGTESNLVEEVLTWHLFDELLQVPESERLDWGANSWSEYLSKRSKKRDFKVGRDEVYTPESIANPPLPASLPLERYAGTYTNPGYGLFEVQWDAECKTLTNNTNKGFISCYKAKLEHISGDHFLIVTYPDGSPDDPQYCRAEFRLGTSGKVAQLGVGIEEAMGEKNIWFDPVAEEKPRAKQDQSKDIEAKDTVDLEAS